VIVVSPLAVFLYVVAPSTATPTSPHPPTTKTKPNKTKGAEIIRLYHTLLGADGFRKGMDLYFKRHDGQAVTCDDFLAAMSDANGGADLSGVGKWYSQAGTPQLSVKTEYDAAKATFTVTTKQTTPPTAGQPAKVPVMIPVKVGLIGPDGKDLPLRLQGSDADLGTTTVLRCDAATNTFVFTGVTARPVPSLLRDFSAPVKMTVEGQTDEDLVFLFANDSDEFNRWDAGQRLAMKLVTSLYAAAAKANADSADEASVAAACGAAGGVSEAFAAAFKAVVTADDIDGSFKAMAVTLPSVAEIVDALPEADPVLAYRVRAFVNKQLAARLRPELEALVAANDDAPGAPFVFDAAASARRAAKNKALALLSTLGDESVTEQLLRRFRAATNMTDRISALACLAETPGAARDAALAEYYEANKAKPLNMLKWLAVQAGSGAAGNLTAVKDLTAHPAFAITNPNSCYSLYLGFARSAPNFHAADGSGYEFLADAVLKLDKVNAIVASRVASAFTTYRQYDKPRQDLMRAQLARIAAAEGLTENVYEIVSKSLEQ
jgi:aminopeptidase N